MPAPEQIAAALSDITAKLVDGHDADTVLRMITAACTRLLDASATGVMLVDPRGGIRVVAASDERARFVELLQSQIEEGPCVDCIRDDVVVSAVDLARETDRWPEFTPAATAAGYRAVHAIPMRLDNRALGGLNVLFTGTAPWAQWQYDLARTLADLSVLGLSQEGDSRRADRLVEHTLTTMNDRVRLAHATGLVAGSLNLDPERASALIHQHAGAHRTPVRDITRALVDGSLDPAALAPPAEARQERPPAG
ncbi:GAF and ANTAR domain-containing protein [Actinosynnema sp. NPDC047251]|uniref:Response regulator receiver and ANTAR domain-containing protein n=1 Tax=Saccharothrix espanaensis (strain ATCC 51144 / DSM 44229 / JCM 9112 / NBRC 15066 / NRRL 15764) TaxID=1179773 RepID=K0K4R5_SACES|nr:GAF and ANTAR domain-containing protein [Saccharothrix espanaensis]CCH32577.1 Response regulator receiver and ANTAR domain-containing protein [Saccharothrix espanaensis DSM 44229]